MNENQFYIMLADTPWAGPVAEVIKGPDIMVNNGVALDSITESYQIHLSVDEKAGNPHEFSPCDIHGPGRSLLFSKEFIDILASLGVENVQYFDADVTYLPTGKKYAYKVSNIVGIVSGLDMEHSEVLLSPRGNVIEIERMKLDESKLKGHKMVRLQESAGTLVIVHESIKNAVDNAGLRGFLFLRDHEYKPGFM